MLLRSPRQRRLGASAVEFALVLPLLATLVVGTFEISRGILVKETLSNVVYRAARTASLPAKKNAQVEADLDEVLTEAGFSNYTTTIRVNGKIADVKTAEKGDRVSVQVSVSVSKIYWLTSQFLRGDQVISETVVMMRQG